MKKIDNNDDALKIRQFIDELVQSVAAEKPARAPKAKKSPAGATVIQFADWKKRNGRI